MGGDAGDGEVAALKRKIDQLEDRLSDLEPGVRGSRSGMQRADPDPDPVDSLLASRRDLLRVGTVAAAGLGIGVGAGAGSVAAQEVVGDGDTGVQDYALLVGSGDPPAIDRLSDTDQRRLVEYRLFYKDRDTAAEWVIETGDNQWTQISMQFPETQVDEVRTENYQSFFNHTFARPEAPDSKSWNFTPADVTKFDSEIELAATTTLESTQRGNYPAGSEAIPGVAARVTGTPTAGRADAGYFDANDGLGVGEDATDSYVFIRKGGTEKRVYRTDWNRHVPAERVWLENRPVITRFPHLFYGGGDLEVRAILHDGSDSTLTTLHRFTPESVDDTLGNGPPIDQPNLPITFESDGLTGGSLRANASHYEFGEVETEERANGEHFTGVDAGTSGWTELIMWQKRSGWEAVNVQPLKISVVAESADAKIGLQLDPSVSSTTTALPTNTSSSETAIEIVDGTVDALGERRWVGYVASGQGSSAGQNVAGDLTFNLPADQIVGLFAQGVGGTATLSGAVAWEEFF